jgi:hypothetical protein
LEATPGATRDPWFVALREANGHLTWSRTFAGRINNSPHVAFAGDDIVVGSEFEESLDLGDGITASVGAEDIFVARFDDAGKLLWKRAFGGDYHEGLGGLAVDAQGSIVLSGFSASLTRPLTFGGPAVQTDLQAFAGFIAKLDAQGNHVWTRIIPDLDFGAAYSPPACALDANGAAHVAGQSSGSASSSAFVGKFAP